MSRQTPVTHADLAPTPRAKASLASKGGVCITIICILSGILCFILCLFAEATRSQVTWEASGDICKYSSNGRTPMACAAAAFLGLAAAMAVQHTFMLVSMSSTPPPRYVSWDPAATQAARVRALTWQAGFFFVFTWLCFAVAEILLLIAISVESDHLKKWQEPRRHCLVVQRGLFTAASIFSLLTIVFAAGLYACAIRMQWLCKDQDDTLREVAQAAAALDMPTSPPRSPTHQLSTKNLQGTKSSLV